MRYIVGVDIGGTNVVVGTVPEDGSTVHGLCKEHTRTGNGGDAVVTQVKKMVEDSLRATKAMLGAEAVEVAGVGVGAPGPLSTETGVVHLTPNLGWREFPLRDRMRDATGLHATIDNDANCAIFGEWWRGAGRNAGTVVGLTIGTGIGGGIVLDGRIYHGASDIAGEIGHMSIDSTGRRCKCGNYGCIEAYASGSAIATRAIEGIEAGAETRLPTYVGGDLTAITAQVVYDAGKDGDEFALEIIKDTAGFLGTAVANLVNIFNPEVVVICGGVTAAGDRLFRPLRAEVKRRAFRPAVEVCRIVPGELAGTAGVYGAVAAFKVQTWGGA
jgi:glucokinase